MRESFCSWEKLLHGLEGKNGKTIGVLINKVHQQNHPKPTLPTKRTCQNVFIGLYLKSGKYYRSRITGPVLNRFSQI